jgi:lysozyme
MTEPKSNAGPVAGGAAAIALVVALVASHEGYVPKVYKDPIAILTVCYGHTGPELRMGQTYTKAECEAYLAQDLAEAQATVRRCITSPMLPHQEAALISFAFNVGPGRKESAPGRKDGKDGLCVLNNGNHSTMRRKANAGDWVGACAEFSKWTKAGGIVFRGLVRRRTEERALCEGRA